MKRCLCLTATRGIVCVLVCLVGCPPSPPLRPAVTSFAINTGDAQTTIRTVTLNNTCTGSPTHYMASESSSFTGAAWRTYATAPAFSLSSGNGAKTVYFKVKNANGQSSPASDTITLNESVSMTEETIILPGGVPLVMVWMPAGSFMMGRYPGEQDSESYEDPQHWVTFSSGFWMGKYEVTQAQWRAIMGTNPSSFSGDDRPVERVSWNDIQAFIAALNTATGRTFRLPSEAEWEYACRAGANTRFYWGDDSAYLAIGTYAWYRDNSGSQTRDVGGKWPNGWGLHDMSGNVWEWCEDDWHANYTGAPTNGSAWTDSPRGPYRLNRGGGWLSYGACRSASRGFSSPSFVSSGIGFRLVR